MELTRPRVALAWSHVISRLGVLGEDGGLVRLHQAGRQEKEGYTGDTLYVVNHKPLSIYGRQTDGW